MPTPKYDPHHPGRQAERRGVHGLSRRRFLQLTGALGAIGGELFAAAPAAAQPTLAKETLKTVGEVAGAAIPEAQLEKLVAPLEGYFRAVSAMRQVDAGLTEPITVVVMREE